MNNLNQIKKYMSSSFLALVCAVSFADGDVLLETVESIASTNSLETWEGVYSFREAVSLNGGLCVSNSCCLCIYGRDNGEGTLLEVYRQGSNGIEKVLAADENVKGVTPVILQFGVSTNQLYAFWSLWRHPGNGGELSHMSYFITNDILSVGSRHEYCDFGDGKRWYLAIDEDEYVSETNFNISVGPLLWTNTNTVYSSVGY